MLSSDQNRDTCRTSDAELHAFAETYGVQIPPGSNRIEDAFMYPGEWPEHILSGTSTVTYARSAKSSRWISVTEANSALLGSLCCRRWSHIKDGEIVCWGAFQANGRRFVHRREAEMTSVAWFVRDVDGGTPLSVAIEAIRRSGFAAVIATTHSSTPELHKYRCLFPLWEELLLKKQGSSLLERKRNIKVGRILTIGSLGITHDPTDDNLAQAHYLPASRPGAPFFAAVLPGRAVEVPPLAELKREAVKLGLAKKSGGSNAMTARRGLEFDEPELRELRSEVGNFVYRYGERLDIITMLEVAGWEIRQHQGADKAVIACPNDDAHSNPGDPSDVACAAFSPEASSNGFAVITCRHAHCQELGTADFLALALHQLQLADPIGWLHSNVYEVEND